MGKSNRIKKPAAPPAIQTREEVEEAVCSIVDEQLQIESLVARRDTEVAAVTIRYNPSILERIERINGKLKDVEAWANANRVSFEGKSLSLGGASIGWRLGNFAATLLRKKPGWAAVVKACKDLPKTLQELFIRTKEEANKEAMIAAREKHAEELKLIGVKVAREETFFINPKRDGQAKPALRTETSEPTTELKQAA